METQNQFEARTIVLPADLLLATVANAVQRPKNSFEAERASSRRVNLANSIRGFTERAIRDCTHGGRILMPRDFIPEAAVLEAKQAGGPQALRDLEMTLVNIRVAVGDILRSRGADVMVEEGILTTDHFREDSPRTLLPSASWTRLSGTPHAAKVNPMSTPISTGPRPSHRFLHQETVYSLHGADEALADRFEINRPDIVKFYATTAVHAATRKNMLEALYLINADTLEKYMLDMMNAMEAISFLHEKHGMIHRDIKPENIFEGGVVFDNISIINAIKIIGERFNLATPMFEPSDYAVNWEKPTLYFQDIFAFAMSIAEGISMDDETATTNKLVDFFELYSKKVRKNLHPEHFVKHLKSAMFSGTKNEKLIKAENVVEKMILGEGKYTLADTLRDMAAIFGSRR